MRKAIIKILSPFLKFFARVYFSKPRKYKYKDLDFTVLPGVFHPFFTISTKLLLEFIDTKELIGKSFLELGCGTGVVSCLAAHKGAQVTASDINPKAIENARENAKNNNLTFDFILSDLFQEIQQQLFDYIVINPPYYPKEPTDEKEKAWYCGKEFEYFQELFSSIGGYFDKSSEVYMILSEDCEIKTIQNLAKESNLCFETVLKKKKNEEWNYIFQINKESNSF